ncbi:hypothetical protein [Muricoccus radiodurans]|uniref:hypothetical protein n=1 Tax=Muricoccus radiodurans TaxID=2231721 RepID=UPI003CF24882
MTLFRVVQAIGVLALAGCAVLALQGTPLLGPEWSRARVLYAGAGAVSALSLLALGRLGVLSVRAAAERAEILSLLRARDGR